MQLVVCFLQVACCYDYRPFESGDPEQIASERHAAVQGPVSAREEQPPAAARARRFAAKNAPAGQRQIKH